MLFNPADKESRKQAAIVFSECLDGHELFEIVRKGARTLRQNSYLHLCLQYLACEMGLRMEYVKEEYYKKIVNKDLYCYPMYDKMRQQVVMETRSSKALSKEDMATSISRLKIWAAQEAEIVLPDAEDKKGVMHMQLAVDRNKQYI